MHSADQRCHVEDPPGSGRKRLLDNPMTADTLLEVAEGLLRQVTVHSISFTGGEPLLYHAFLKQALPRLRSLAPIYLETSGTQPDFLAEVLPWVDIVAMDIKLPSSTLELPRYAEHAAFYQLARSRAETETFVKIVFNAAITPDEIDAVQAIVTDPQTPIILQPETSLADRQVHVPPAVMWRIAETLSKRYADVRVIPQTHKLLNVL